MKRVFYSFLLLMLSCLFTACSGFPKETYTYKTEDELSVSILKTKVYDDKLMVKFSDGAFSSVEYIRCYDQNFEEILKDVEFEAKDDVLTIYTEEADKISGLKVTVNEMLYYDIRYLDSECYAMLRGDWADDYGYFVSGDNDAYYTEAEKEKQKQLQEERLAARDRAYAMVEGTWESEDGLTRIIIFDVESPTIEIYEYSGGAWNLVEQIIGYYIYADERQEPVCVSIEEPRGYSVMYEFYMSEDMTEFECGLMEGKFKKVSE